MQAERTFLGLVYVVNALLKIDVLHYDPNNHNNMLIYYSGDDQQPEGWYSANILSSVSELYHDEEQMNYVLSIATEHNIDIEKCFADAKEMIKPMEEIFYESTV